MIHKIHARRYTLGGIRYTVSGFPPKDDVRTA